MMKPLTVITRPSYAGLLVLAACGAGPTSNSPSGAWSYQETGDPQLGTQVRIASLAAETGPTSLHVRCQASDAASRVPPLQLGSLGAPGRLEIYVSGDASTEGPVRYQLDQQPERQETWTWSDSFKSLFYPSDTRSFAQAISDGDTLKLEYPETGGGSVSSIFAVRGLDSYLDRLFADCLAVILKISGDGQTGPKGSLLPEPLVVELRNSDGNPLPDATVSWRAEGAHSGQVSSLSSTTDSEGHASVSWTIGDADVSHVTAIGIGMVTFTATGIP